MLRMVLNVRRRTFSASADSNSVNTDTEDSESDSVLLEPWAEFLKRTAQWTHQQLENAGLSQWTVQWKRKKWQWAAKLVQNEVHKWSSSATLWQPLTHSSVECGRKQARPKKRWEQDFIDYMEACPQQQGKHWHDLANDKHWWISETERSANA